MVFSLRLGDAGVRIRIGSDTVTNWGDEAHLVVAFNEQVLLARHRLDALEEDAVVLLEDKWATHDDEAIRAAISARTKAVIINSPNNPTGAAITKEQLAKWVAYARENDAVILYDAAYVAFIQDTSLPQSIYEIDGAKEVAIEFRSFSKTAGFTGTRCAYTVVPKACTGMDKQGNKQSLHALWNRRHNTKFNGVSYPVQRAAEAVYSPAGQKEVRELVNYYLKNAALVRKEVSALGYNCTGGDNSPYIWIDGKTDSWEFFDLLLHKAGVVCTPGEGFGRCGRGYIRISAFNSFENVQAAMNRMKETLT